MTAVYVLISLIVALAGGGAIAGVIALIRVPSEFT